MKFDEAKENSTTYEKKYYPTVKVTTKLERIIKKGTTDKGSWIVLGFERGNSAIYFEKNKENIDKKLDGIEIGNLVDLELSGSQKGNVIKNIVRTEEVEGENPSTSHLSDKDMRAFVPDSVFIPSFKCGNCGEDNVSFKHELRDFILNTVRNYHEN